MSCFAGLLVSRPLMSPRGPLWASVSRVPCDTFYRQFLALGYISIRSPAVPQTVTLTILHFHVRRNTSHLNHCLDNSQATLIWNVFILCIVQPGSTFFEESALGTRGERTETHFTKLKGQTETGGDPVTSRMLGWAAYWQWRWRLWSRGHCHRSSNSLLWTKVCVPLCPAKFEAPTSNVMVFRSGAFGR